MELFSFTLTATEYQSSMPLSHDNIIIALHRVLRVLSFNLI